MPVSCLAAALVPFAFFPPGETHLVDFYGVNGFSSIQAAVDSAASGDTIVIMEPDGSAPTRPGFVIDGKGLTMLVVETALHTDKVHIGKCTIQNVPLGATVSLHSLHFEPNSYASPVHGLEILQSPGAVRVESCAFERPRYWEPSPSASLDLVSSLDVSLVECSLTGNVEGGIRASGSRVSLFHCDVTGRQGRSAGSYTHAIAGTGHTAIELKNRSFAWIGASTVQGGGGGDADCIHGANCVTESGDGGIGLVIEPGSYGVLLDSSVTAGQPGWSSGSAAGSSVGVPGVDIVGTPLMVPGGQRSLYAPRYLDMGGSLDVSVEGLPGERAQLFIGTEAGLRYLGPLHGSLLVNGGLLGAPIDLGVIPATGVLEATVQLPAQAVEQSTTYLLQAYCQTAPTRYRTTLPRQVTVLGENAPLMSAPERLFVRADAPHGGRGGSWRYAARNLSDALASLPKQGSPTTEIWLAHGTYTPAPSANSLSRNGLNLRRGVSLLGGFVGNESTASERPLLSQSTISGDLLGDDLTPGGTRDDNSFGLVGFAVTSGQNLTRVSGVHFTGAIQTAVNLSAAEIEFDRCTFSVNGNGTGGGAVDMFLSNLLDHHAVFRSCRFVDNYGSFGGAITARASHQSQLDTRIVLQGCEFIGNRGRGRAYFSFTFQVKYGGALLSTSPTTGVEITNCTFLDNEATPEISSEQVGFCGIYTSGGPVIFRNNACSNALSESGAYPVFGTLDSTQGHVTEFNASAWSGVGWGASNVSMSPGFVDRLGPDGIRATGDEDLRLRAGSPCIDAGHSFVLPSAIQYDLLGEPRYTDDPTAPNVGVGGTRFIDIGAYERQ